MLNKPEQDPIDGYLRDVIRYMRAMPLDEAMSALHEMRSHLRAAVSELVENGIEEEQAVADVLKRFGTAKTVGQAIAKASLKAWLTEVDKREGIFVARSLRMTMFFARYGMLAIVCFAFATGRHNSAAWVLAASFCIGAMSGSLEIVASRLARRRLPSLARLNELSTAYAQLSRLAGEQPSGNNAISQARMYFRAGTKTSDMVFAMILFGTMSAVYLYVGLGSSRIFFFWAGKVFGDYIAERMPSRLNGNIERLKN